MTERQASSNGTAATPPRADEPARARRPRYVPLLGQVALINAAVVVAAVAVVAALAPGHVGEVVADDGIVVGVALIAVGAGNFFLLRRAFAPLRRLTGLTRTVDLIRPGERVPLGRPRSEAMELGLAFNQMLARLEAERRESTRRALAAQERERLRVAQELHDEVGQTLTAVLLQLGQVAKRAPDELRRPLGDAQETARASLDDVRRIAQELRPEALDELGLAPALASLAERFSHRTGLRVAARLEHEPPAIGEEAELVVYRVAQEALTNVTRHAGCAAAELRLTAGPRRLTLEVLDAGRGIDPAHLPDGGGARGMRERALLVGAELRIARRPEGGTAVRLDVPLPDDPARA